MQNNDLLKWLLLTLSQKDEDVVSVHIPVILAWFLQKLRDKAEVEPFDSQAVELATIMLSAISPSAFAHTSVSLSATMDCPLSVDWLYLNGTSQQEGLQSRISTETIPQIVHTVFAICVKAFRDHKSSPEVLLRTLEMTSRLIDHEAAAIMTINGTAWMGTLIDELTNVRLRKSDLLIVSGPVLCSGRRHCDRNLQS